MPGGATELTDDGFIVVREPQPSGLNLAWVIPVGVVALAAVFGAGWWGGSAYTSNQQTEQGAAVLAGAREFCDPTGSGTTFEDRGRTLSIDGRGTDDLSSGSGLEPAAINCVLDQVGVPPDVQTRMGQTTPEDGEQTGEWAGYSATWSYRMETGFDLVLRAV
ncbi:hypothetical protein [Actinoplanes sp. DH11]|uniref:hypothetical protein n=1 Tax=Actinoplanes sp. DH11 TaxID=2857011 RepID=UPI001E508E5B|nr:hypothetical protein [Actinoplanes sp. DH11]